MLGISGTPSVKATPSSRKCMVSSGANINRSFKKKRNDKNTLFGARNAWRGECLKAAMSEGEVLKKVIDENTELKQRTKDIHDFNNCVECP